MWKVDSLEKTLMLGGIGAGGEGDSRGWDGWMASLTRWAWVWVNSGSWWWIGRPGVLRFMGSQKVRHDWVTELTWTEFWKWRVILRILKKDNLPLQSAGIGRFLLNLAEFMAAQYLGFSYLLEALAFHVLSCWVIINYYTFTLDGIIVVRGQNGLVLYRKWA